MAYLKEHLTFDQANIQTQIVEGSDGAEKDMYLSGLCLRGEVKNANRRTYPVTEIRNAVGVITEQIKSGQSVLGEVDHPDDLKINIDRVSHMITEMWMSGNDGYGKLKIIPTPMGQLVKTMIENGVKLGVSSRGSGNVHESTGSVSDFEIVTVDIVAQPSAGCFPKAIYESLMNERYGHRLVEMAAEVSVNPKIQEYMKRQLMGVIKKLQ